MPKAINLLDPGNDPEILVQLVVEDALSEMDKVASIYDHEHGVGVRNLGAGSRKHPHVVALLEARDLHVAQRLESLAKQVPEVRTTPQYVNLLQRLKNSYLGARNDKEVARLVGQVIPVRDSDPRTALANKKGQKRLQFRLAERLKGQELASSTGLPDNPRGWYGSVEDAIEKQHRDVILQTRREKKAGLEFREAPEIEELPWDGTEGGRTTAEGTVLPRSNPRTEALRARVQEIIKSQPVSDQGDRLKGALKEIDRAMVYGGKMSFADKNTVLREILSDPSAHNITAAELKVLAPNAYGVLRASVRMNVADLKLSGEAKRYATLAYEALEKHGNVAAANAYGKAVFAEKTGKSQYAQQEAATAKAYFSRSVTTPTTTKVPLSGPGGQLALFAKRDVPVTNKLRKIKLPIERPEVGVDPFNVGSSSEFAEDLGEQRQTLSTGKTLTSRLRGEDFLAFPDRVVDGRPANTLKVRMQVEERLRKGGGLNDLERLAAGKWGPRPDRMTAPIDVGGARDLPLVFKSPARALPKPQLSPGWEGVLAKAAASGDPEAGVISAMLKGAKKGQTVEGLGVFLGKKRLQQLLRIVSLLK